MTVDEIMARYHQHSTGIRSDVWWNYGTIEILVAEIERLRRDDAAMRSSIADMNETITVLEDDQTAKEGEIERLRAEIEWQPVDWCIVDNPNPEKESLWLLPSGHMVVANCFQISGYNPTHWRPLPAPPKEETR